jgi:putative transposase
MKRSRFTEEQIFSILHEADAGDSVKEVCRRHGIAPATYYQWKAKYGGLQPSDLKKLKELERENSRLKQLYAELSIENKALKDLIDRKL